MLAVVAVTQQWERLCLQACPDQLHSILEISKAFSCSLNSSDGVEWYVNMLTGGFSAQLNDI